MVILVSTPDDQCDVTALSAAIQSYLLSQLGNTRNYTSLDFPDKLREILVLLWMHDMDKHQYLWLQATLELMKVARGVVEIHQDVTPTLKARLHDIFGAVDRFLAGWNMGIVKSPTVTAPVQQYILLLQNTCDALVIGRDILNGVANVMVLSSSIARFVRQNNTQNMLILLFPVLVSIAKASFFYGVPEAVAPVVDAEVISESMVMNLLENNKPNFTAIMDYYRYYAYCFVTLAISGDSIDQRYCDNADVFFRILLQLPNLQLSNYTQVPGRLELHYFSETDREELSFFFLLNEQIRCTTLAQYMRMDTLVIDELCFFLVRFNNRVLKDLSILASSYQSYSSTTSVPNMEKQLPPVGNSRTLSAILFDGTYKEKINLVLELFPRCGCFRTSLPKYTSKSGNLVSLVKRFNVSSSNLNNQETIHCVNNIDSARYPGKMLYVRAIDKMVRLLELLAILHLNDTVGICTDGDAVISRMFGTGHTFGDVAAVKNIAKVDDEGKCSRFHGKSVLEEMQVAEQMRVLERTKRLEECVQLLV